MIRMLSAIGALAATSCLLTGVAASHNARRPVAPVVIGADRPVFLGRMVVTATPLPAE